MNQGHHSEEGEIVDVVSSYVELERTLGLLGAGITVAIRCD